uniref:Uncharacterized protein n=1 Tax=viral metagenome TaxID=1070528 RepID=A0A6C0JWB0_9ZZZZ
MTDSLFKTPQEVLNEIFSTDSVLKTDNVTFLVLISIFVIAPLCIFIYIYLEDIKNILFKLGSALYLTDFEKLQLLFDCIKNNIGIILGPIFLAVILFYATHDPKALTDNTTSYALFIFAIIIICFGLYSTLPNFSNMSYVWFLIGGIVLLLISMAVYFSSYITPSVITTVSIFMRILVLLIIAVGLAIGYKIFSERIKSLTGWKGFFANFLFYIPCLLSDGLEYLLQQYHITPNIVFILLIIELVLVLGYFYIPKIIKKSIKKTAIMLQDKPVYLDKERNVGNIEQFLFKPLGDKIIYMENKEKYRRNYCINMWVFLNIQPSSNAAYSNETTIFNYNNHPRITHKNNSDNKRLKNRNIYTFYFSNTQDGTVNADTTNKANYEVSFPDQKWNLFSFNYFESKVDLYVNGHLERTFYFSNNIPDYSSNDSVLLGSDGGVTGAICNVTYNKKPLTSEQIATLYNTNYLKNPPVDFIE